MTQTNEGADLGTSPDASNVLNPDSKPEIDDLLEALRDVVDPELGINVVDLGLVYGVSIDAERVATVDMTLTSAACPLTDVIEDQTQVALDGLSATSASTGCGCPRGVLTRSPRTAASSCARSASTSKPCHPALRLRAG